MTWFVQRKLFFVSFSLQIFVTIFAMMNSFEHDILNCLTVLQNGGIILYPTDTIWGIGCDATNATAVAKIGQLKNRPDEKNFVVLVNSESEVMQHAASLDLLVFDYLNNTTKPTTVIYDHAIGLAENVIANDGSVAIRICKDEFCKHLIKRFRKPIVSTSANISGMPSPQQFSAIDNAIKIGVDYMVKYRQDENSVALPSSIIRWKNGQVSVIRP